MNSINFDSRASTPIDQYVTHEPKVDRVYDSPIPSRTPSPSWYEPPSWNDYPSSVPHNPRLRQALLNANRTRMPPTHRDFPSCRSQRRRSQSPFQRNVSSQFQCSASIHSRPDPNIHPSWLQVHYHRSDTNQWISDSNPELIDAPLKSDLPVSPPVPVTIDRAPQCRQTLLYLYHTLHHHAPALRNLVDPNDGSYYAKYHHAPGAQPRTIENHIRRLPAYALSSLCGQVSTLVYQWRQLFEQQVRITSHQFLPPRRPRARRSQGRSQRQSRCKGNDHLVPSHRQSRSPPPKCPRPPRPSIGHVIAYVQSSAPISQITSNPHQATCYIASHVKLSRSQSCPELQSGSFLSPVRHRNRSIDVYNTPYGSIIAVDSSIPDPHVKPNFSRHVCVLTTNNKAAMCKGILPSSTHSSSGNNRVPPQLSIPSTSNHHSPLLDVSHHTDAQDEITSFHSEVASIRQQDLSFDPRQSINDLLGSQTSRQSIHSPLEPLTNSFGDPNHSPRSLLSIGEAAERPPSSTSNFNPNNLVRPKRSKPSPLVTHESTQTHPTDDLNASLSERIRNLNQQESSTIPLSPTSNLLSALPGYLVEANVAQLIAELPKCQIERIKLREDYSNPLVCFEKQVQETSEKNATMNVTEPLEAFDKLFKTTQRHQQFSAFRLGNGH